MFTLINLSIDFYDESTGAINMAWTKEALSPIPAAEKGHPKWTNEQRYFETGLFACYTLRHLRNLGNHPAGDALIEELKNWEYSTKESFHESIVILPHHVIFSAALTSKIISQEAKKRYGKPLYLVKYNGNGKRRFTGSLSLRPPNNAGVFLHKTKGFGLGILLGKDIPQYSANSVILFFAYLVHSNSSDSKYVQYIKSVALDCVDAYQNRRVTTSNQEKLAFSFAHANIPYDIKWMNR